MDKQIKVNSLSRYAENLVHFLNYNYNTTINQEVNSTTKLDNESQRVTQNSSDNHRTNVRQKPTLDQLLPQYI